MSRSPGSIDDRKKQAVLGATLELCLAHGDRFSIAEVARRSGVSRQTIYNQFGGKRGLLQAFTDPTGAARPLRPPCGGQSVEDLLTIYAQRLMRRSDDASRARFIGLCQKGAHVPAHEHIGAVQILADRLRQSGQFVDLDAVQLTLVARLFFNLVIGAHALWGGARVTLTDDDLNARAREAARFFLRGYGGGAQISVDVGPPRTAAPLTNDRARAFTTEETSP